MLDEVKRKFRRLVRDAAKHRPGKKHREDHEVRIPEESQPGGPGRADEAEKVTPPRRVKSNGDGDLVSDKERRHDGYADIRPRRPGEDTDMGRDLVPDITMPGRDLRPPDDDDEEQEKGGAR